MKIIDVDLEEDLWLWLSRESTRQNISVSDLLASIAREAYMPERHEEKPLQN